ncbi:hypothetical protein C8A01DRAFT_40830 [Parachaetomium inaequale]|uniref:Uncharacterized protein n=1 Tax=Parachaetomium inaequale TaxID=2588326 RepID=A0AAN6SMM2_9PEZI|nr:hypothetical protein C8A01DRAFT_40830 [Parachaetomium inaequale]
MTTPRNTTPAQLDAWLLEDIQIRKLHLNPSPNDLPPTLPTHTHTTTTKTTTTTTTTTTNTNMHHPPTRNDKTHTHNHIDPLAEERTALRLALDLSRQQETDRQAVAEQQKLEASFREAKERRKREWERKEKWRQEREEVERKIELQRERERVLRIEEEVRAERERERERVLREAEAKTQVEREVMRKVKELEEAAVARAVEESIISEAARKLIDQAEREKRRVEEVAERMRVEAEARAQEERLRRRVEGKKGREWPRGGTKTVGFDESAGMYGPGLPPLGPRVADVRAFVGDDTQREPFHVPTPGPYRTTYAGNDGLSDPPPEPTWYRYTPPLTASTSARRGSFDSDTLPPRRWDRGLDLDPMDETHAAGWRNAERDTRYWRETTTERWETIIHREEDGRGAYRRYKEASKPPRRFF